VAGRRVVVAVTVDAPVERVWRALCDPTEVAVWDGARPASVPVGYPRPGQHARWRTTWFGLPVVLHDRVRAVEAPRRLAARITYAGIDIDEEYRLDATAPATTTVTSDNLVRSRPRGFSRLAVRHTRRSVEAAMRRLAEHCARR
jgi:uncharacterized protein YndB with AHSA1/START domain